jgi:hypothetical protein
VVHAAPTSVVFDFEDGTDDGFGNGFGGDATASWPIVSIGGSKRMELTPGGFQVAGRPSQGFDQFLAAMNTAVYNPSLSTISYDWYVDTSINAANVGTFLQIGTYINAGDGAYAQHEKEVELSGTQLASGSVFSGTVTQSLSTKFGALATGPGTFVTNPIQTFQRLGFILNASAVAAGQLKVYIDNVRVDATPEPASIVLAGLSLPLLGLIARRRRK